MPEPGESGADGLGLGPDTDPGADPGAEPGAVVPVVRAGTSEVRGSLSREIIQRVVRRNINAVRRCYEQGLTVDPSLAGRVTIAFTVDATGAVSAASVANSSFAPSNNTGSVHECMLSTVRTWRFPAPDGGGIVAITYPFVFESE